MKIFGKSFCSGCQVLPKSFVVGVRFSATHFVVRLWSVHVSSYAFLRYSQVLRIYMGLWLSMGFYGPAWSAKHSSDFLASGNRASTGGRAPSF